MPVPWSTVERRCQPCSVSGCPLPCLRSWLPSSQVCHRQARLGLPTCCASSLPACHGLRTPADRHSLAHSGARVLPAGAFTPSASAMALSKLSQHCRGRGHPCGLQETRSTLRPSCSPRVQARLRHGRKTRYGWVARPSPTGTCTLQGTPRLSWRDNARHQARRTAGAQRTLYAVACMPMILIEAPSSAYRRDMLRAA